MARIRTTKPEFWTSEQVVECSPTARLLFIGMWNFCDDRGIHPDSVRRLKMEVFPADAIADAEMQRMVNELLHVKLLEHYTVAGKGGFWRVTGWAKHQKIEKPTYRHPLPNETSNYQESTNALRMATDESPAVRPRKGRENDRNGAGKEWSRVESNNPDGLFSGSDAVAQPSNSMEENCPHQQIIAIYHEVLPQCPPIRQWTAARAKQLRARWNEDVNRQNLGYWRKFFEYVSRCDFLVGRAHENNRHPFFADLEWIVKAANFTKIREGKYANR